MAPHRGAQRMAAHSNAETTGLYDRRHDEFSVGEVERIGYERFYGQFSAQKQS